MFGLWLYAHSAAIIFCVFIYVIIHVVVLHSQEPYSASKYASDLVSYAFNIRLNSKVCWEINFLTLLCNDT